MSAAIAEDLRQFFTHSSVPLRARFVADRLSAGDVTGLILWCHKIDRSCRKQAAQVRRQVLDASREFGGNESVIPLAWLHVVLRDVAQLWVDPSDLVAVWKNFEATAHRAALASAKRRHAAAVAAASSDAVVAVPSAAEAIVHVVPTDPEELSMAVAKLSDQVANLVIEKSNLMKSRNYYRSKVADLREELAATRVQHAETMALVQHRVGARKVTAFAGFNLALKRSLGHSSCQALVLACAGESVFGGLKSKDIITRFEHKASCAIRVESVELQLLINRAVKDPPHVQALAAKCQLSSKWFCLSAFSYRGDATNDVVRNSKVHLAEVCSLALGQASLESMEIHHGQEPSVGIAYARAFCDLQLVAFGTAEETYVNMQKEFLSVGAPCWAKAIDEAAKNPHLLYIFALALDNGPDNQGATSRIKYSLKDHIRVLLVLTWCIFHQYHLIIKSLLVILDRFVWSPPSSPFPTTYFAGVSAISSSWRAAGVPRKIYFAGADAFGDVAAARCCKKIPGRVLKERWGSIDSVEALIDDGGSVLTAAFQHVIGPKLKANARPSTGPAADDDGAFRERCRQHRKNAHELIGNDTFKGMLRISRIAKQPLTAFFYWAQKQRGLLTTKRKDAYESA